LSEWDNVTIGMILDFKITYDNEHLDDEDREEEIIVADQFEFDRF